MARVDNHKQMSLQMSLSVCVAFYSRRHIGQLKMATGHSQQGQSFCGHGLTRPRLAMRPVVYYGVRGIADPIQPAFIAYMYYLWSDVVVTTA